MAIRERLRSIRDELRQEEAAAEQQAKPSPGLVQRARAALETSDDSRVRRRAREILSRADPGTGAGQVSGQGKSRTQRMFERAERSATVAAPIEASVDPTPNSLAMWEFASASPGRGSAGSDSDGGGPSMGSLGDLGGLAEIDASGLLGSHGREPDWHDNPDHLDEPEEVRESLRDSGLDPMDVGTKEQAAFGHFLVHSFADDEDLGGRTPEQLEAEHDLTVQAMRDFGVGHHSPLDRADVDDHPFAFGDEWGLSWGDD